MRVRVHIATTEGPALVQRLAVEEGLSEIELSAVCLDGTATRLPITGAYTYFVRDHVRALSGRAAYRLDLDRRVDGGNSWMLGAWIAHLLLAEGRLAMRDETADLAVFATGEVAFSADARRRTEVRAVERVAGKVAQLAGRVAEEAAAGRRVLLVAPRGNAEEARAALARLPARDRGQVAFHAIAETGEARALLAPGSRQHAASLGGGVQFGEAQALLAPGSRGARRGGGRRLMRKLSVALALCAAVGAAAGYVSWRGVERDWRALWQEGRYLDLTRSLDDFFLPVVAEWFRAGLREEGSGAFPLAVSVAAHRPADGGSCAGLRFRGGATVERPVAASGAVYRLDRPRSLCGFSVRAAGADASGHAWILLRFGTGAGVREALLQARRLAAGAPARGPVSLSQDLPLYRRESWTWAVAVIWTPVPSEDVSRMLGTGDPTELARLEALGVPVHRVALALAR